MPAARTEKECKRYQRTKARSSAQLTNCFGSSRRVLGPTSRQSVHEKENISTSPASSQLPSSPYTRTSGPSSPFTRSDDAFSALQQRSDKYERRYRNLAKKASRDADRKAQLEKRVQDLQEQLRGLEKSSSAFVASLRRQLHDLSEELIQRKRNEAELHARNEALMRKRQALSKKAARLNGRIETGVAKLSTQSLKEDGAVSTEIRACVRDMVSLGAPLESVDKIIHAVAKGLNIQISDHVSVRCAGRIVLEGGVAAHLQIVDAIKDADLPSVAYPEDFRTFFIKITGMMTDDAADQKKLRALFHEMKKRMDREIRGERALLCLTAPKLLDVIYEITEDKIRGAGGMAAWDALAAEERDRRNSTLHAELCQKFGQAEFEKLSEEEMDEADFFHCGGCFMHKDLNAYKGGVERMMAAWLKHGFQQPILLMNKDNAAASNSGSTVARERAEKVSSRGGVKLCELLGLLLNNKDDKKGQQDSHGVYFSAHEHIGYSIRFPDTSNTRYGCYSEAAAEIIVNLTVYRELMQFIRDRKMSLAYTNLEKNIWDAINDVRTLAELVVLLWCGQNFSKPVMRVVRSRTSTGGLPNLWDMGPVLEGVIRHCERVIADPDIIMGPNLSYETASMDGQPWECPEAMYAAHAILSTLPRNEFGSDILRRSLTDVQKKKAEMPATNDANEGWLAQHFGGTEVLAAKAQAISGEGRTKKRKIAQAEHDTRTVKEHREKKTKSDLKKAAEITDINKCVPIFDVSRFTDPTRLKDILVPQIDLQLKWHRLRELELDKKTEIPPFSKLKKQQKAEVIAAAVARWMRRVDAGEVPVMGLQAEQPRKEEQVAEETDEEEEDVGYGEKE
ncbi:hypothetical protein MVEN_01278800 [Mycena venus]|uniref:Uncharacterized protein n=1 Tax=Mycena venus TaxID=2733690 RepID=A0A8H6XX03_9AGAR|nr:hypothetical protein MVEN_01278800 [Mycena venus]